MRLRRGAATDLMEQVGDALAAPRVASVAEERPPYWWIEKGVRTKKAGQSGHGCETGRTKARVPTMAVPRTTRAPRPWAEWRLALWSKMLSIHGVGKAHAKHQEK